MKTKVKILDKKTYTNKPTKQSGKKCRTYEDALGFTVHEQGSNCSHRVGFSKCYKPTEKPMEDFTEEQMAEIEEAYENIQKEKYLRCPPDDR